MASPWLKSTIFLFFFFFTLSLSAQNTVSFNDANGIEIQADIQDIEYSTSFDIVDNISDEKYVAYFKFYNTQLSTLSVDKQTGKAILSLEKRMKPNWSSTDWNLYLKDLHIKALNHQKN